MKPSAKKGFTIVELVAAMVVLTFAALILAVCMGTAWKLRAQAASWQASGAQLNSITAQKLGSPAKLTLTSGSSSLTAGPGSHGGRVAIIARWTVLPAPGFIIPIQWTGPP